MASAPLCTAGKNHFLIYPNGDVYRCMTDYNYKRAPLFNVKNNRWALHQSPKRCDHFSCEAGCDLDWTNKYFVSSESGVSKTIKANCSAYDYIDGSLWSDRPLNDDKPAVAHIIWSPTLVCNYTCVYCGCAASASQIHSIFKSAHPELTTEEWLGIWKKMVSQFAYLTVFLTGGEPLLSPSTIPVLRLLAKRSGIQVTSNLSQDLGPVLKSEDFSKRRHFIPDIGWVETGLLQITASCHPSSRKFNAESFKHRVLDIRDENVSVTVNFVGHRSQLQEAASWKEWCDLHSVDFVISPFIGMDNNGEYANYTDEETRLINSLTTSERNLSTHLIFKSHSHTIRQVINEKRTREAQESIRLTINNTSDYSWKVDPSDPNRMKLGARIRPLEGTRILMELRSEIPKSVVLPGEEFEVDLAIPGEVLPSAAEGYQIELDLLKENEFWFSDRFGLKKTVLTFLYAKNS